MDKCKVMIIGQKETFIIKVLLGKLENAHIQSGFVTSDINAIDAAWNDYDSITFYMEKGESLGEDIARYLQDKLTDDTKELILIGDTAEIKTFTTHIPNSLIYKTLARPLDYEEYISTVSEINSKASSDELKKKILIVDDDPNYMGLVREWLKDEYKVSVATSGLRAIKWLGSNKVDLILLDYEMPVTSGPQVLEMLRSDEDTKEIPVMFLTGKGDKESVMSVLELKPEGYFLKSIGKKELIEQLDEFFIKHR